MKTFNLIKYITAAMLICLPLLATAQPGYNPTLTSSSKTISQNSQAGTAKNARRSTSYSGYEVDGRTSASVLAAKRSHEVSKRDANGLAIFSGVFVICLIVFFTQALSKKK
jgi:hypothetical protein